MVMLRRNKTGFLAISLVVVGALSAGVVSAGTPVLDQRQDNQRSRIVNGVKSGELTRAEAARLAHGQAHLRRHERAAKRDGVVTPRERAALQRDAQQQSRRIYRQKHDAQDRH
jgi:hypothetical protein